MILSIVVWVNKSLERRLYSDGGRYFGQPGLCWDENVSGNFGEEFKGISDWILLLLENIWLELNGNVNVLSRFKRKKF